MKWIIAHGDTDGICSAAIALAAFKNRKVFFSRPTGLADDLKQVDGDVIICDIALPNHSHEKIMRELKRISDAGNKVVYIDHHPLPEGLWVESFPGEFIHSTTSCVAELTYTRLMDFIPADMSRVAIYGAIGDYLDRTYTIEKLIRNWEKRGLYLESGLLIQAIEAGGRNYESKRNVVYFLSTNKIPSSDEDLVAKAISESITEEEMRKRIKEIVKVRGNIAYVLDLQWSLGKTAVYTKAYAGTMVGIGAETRKGFVDMSLRTHCETTNLNKILVAITEKLGGSGGGHPKAAGARVPIDKFQQFLSELDNAVNECAKKSDVEY